MNVFHGHRGRDYGYMIRKCVLGCFVVVFWLQGMLPTEASDTIDDQDIHAQRLFYDLFQKNGYNSMIRPVENTSTSLRVNFTLALSTIINVDEKNQVIITNVWLQMFWHDYQLVWDPEQYGGINETRTRATDVWVPDIVLFNNADGNFEPSFIPNVVIQANGNIKFIPPAIFTSSCTIDVEYFPFDQQICAMKLGSWTFLGKTLIYNFHMGATNLDLSDYNKNGAWDLVACPGHIETINDTITGEPKELIIYELVIRRKTLFYTVNLIIPCFLHACVCLCVFMLPADGCEKITLVISTIVSLIVFLVIVQKILPPSMNIPLIAKYFLFTFIMSVLEIFVSVSIIYANHKSPRTDVMPRWVCWLLLYKLPKYLLMERPDHEERWQQKSCTPPPSYPSTPQIPRANIFPLNVNTPEVRNRHGREGQPMLASLDGHRSREHDRVGSLRHEYRKSHGSGSLTHSSTASESHASADDFSPSQDTIDRISPGLHLPTNGHHCMLRQSKFSQSEDSLDGVTGGASPRPIPARRTPKPLVITKEICSAMNAIKYICHQMRNTEDFEEAMDDWKYAAAVLDRLLMVIFILVSLGGTIGVLVNAPHILETVDQDKVIQEIIDGIR